jgi:hypothetical protein
MSKTDKKTEPKGAEPTEESTLPEGAIVLEDKKHFHRKDERY